MRGMASRRFLVPRAAACGLALALFLGSSPRAQACSFGANQHQLDAAETAIDLTAPSKPTIGAVTIKRGRGPSRVGCQASGSSCDDIGAIAFVLSATDDRTPETAMGYRVTVSRGKAPPDLFPSGVDVRASSGQLWFHWLDGASDDQEGLDFDLDVRAVDLAGHVSADSSTVTIRQDTGGCSVGRGSRSTGDGLGVVVVGIGAWAMTRRRRMTTRRQLD
jgi:hypothetical protein